mmetsp:Transcript_8624/g.14056  ORF Transcript_8624/g.14056 Transcript_8624/m.14056 type:complete len:140 (+) Transcript_8624:1865-2284(+)
MNDLSSIEYKQITPRQDSQLRIYLGFVLKDIIDYYTKLPTHQLIYFRLTLGTRDLMPLPTRLTPNIVNFLMLFLSFSYNSFSSSLSSICWINCRSFSCAAFSLMDDSCSRDVMVSTSSDILLVNWVTWDLYSESSSLAC